MSNISEQYKHYTYRVTWSTEDNEYVGLCAEFPSLSYLAKTQVEALDGIVSLIYSVIKDMKSNNELVPEPLSEKKYSGNLKIKIAPETHRWLALQAAEHGISLNLYINSKLAL